jgi:dihydrofolate synthase/folylpolyglutamate synthase
MHFQTYTEAVDYLFARRARGMKLGLENEQELLRRLGNPQQQFHSIHIAGTNGKGSTAAVLESILKHAGYKTGLFTSPHLIDMRERMTVRGKWISENEVLEYLRRMLPHIEVSGASFFEILTAMAFLHFADKDVELAVLETGLGGRLDATNLITPVLTMITEIGLDHTRILGKTLKEITREKAGILKKGIPCLAGTRSTKIRGYLKEMTKANESPLHLALDEVRINKVRLSEQGSLFNAAIGGRRYEDIYLSLIGEHQIRNAGLALHGIEILNRIGWSIPEKAIRKGLKDVHWPARLQLLQTKPKVLLDAAHNPMGMSTLVKTLKEVFSYQRMILVFGVLADKAYPDMFSRIAPLADRIVCTKPLSDRALEPAELLTLPEARGKPVDVIPNILKAWDTAIGYANKDDLVCAAGSIYFIGEILRKEDPTIIQQTNTNGVD